MIHRFRNSLRTNLHIRREKKRQHDGCIDCFHHREHAFADRNPPLFSLSRWHTTKDSTLSISKGGSPSSEEMRMICSSSFLPRNKGSPVQISYWKWGRDRIDYQNTSNTPHINRWRIGKTQNDFRSPIIATLNVGKETASHVTRASEIDEFNIRTVEFRE